MKLFLIYIDRYRSGDFSLYGITDSLEKANKLCRDFLDKQLRKAKEADDGGLFEYLCMSDIDMMKRKRKAWTECGSFKIVECQTDIIYDTDLNM